MRHVTCCARDGGCAPRPAYNKVSDKKTSGAGKGSPPTTPKAVAPVDSPAAPVCAPSPSGKVKDSHETELKLAAAYFCKQHASETGAKGPIDINHAIMAGDRNMSRTTVKMAFPYPPSMGNQDDVYDISLKFLSANMQWRVL
ncbi:MAG: hypothetical protein M1823_005932 [Watsoniomyces obsoletus]|nr:MAG: hypothetical protein M1823_005932 [Watsoniomyces obsoletus]